MYVPLGQTFIPDWRPAPGYWAYPPGRWVWVPDPPPQPVFPYQPGPIWCYEPWKPAEVICETIGG